MNLQPKQTQSVVRSSATVAASATGADQSGLPFPLPIPCEEAEQSFVVFPYVPFEDVGA